MTDNNKSNVTIVVQTLGRRSEPAYTINSLGQKPPKKKRRGLKIALALFLLLLTVGGGYVLVRAENLTNKIFVGQKSTFFQKVQGLLRGSTGSIKLTGEDLGQVNILLLGVGGEGHDGPYLSDSIILAQIRPDVNAVSMTSIPRDYLVNLPGYGYRKINAAFAEGYYKNRDFDEAGRMARETVEKISGLQIPYFAVIDFRGFTEAIDTVGGLDITIDRSFTDYSYPDNKGGYLAPQTFKQGHEHMNGSRALIFSRSRHAAGPEGSDFSRSQRQQKIIREFKDKVVSLNLVTNPASINGLAEVFADHFHTNISPGEIYRLYQLTKGFTQENVFATSLDPKTLLTCPKILEETGAYVLVPRAGKSENDIKNFFKNSFVVGKVAQEEPRIWIAAPSETNKNFTEISKTLIAANVTPLFIKSSGTQPELEMYVLNSKPGTVDYLKATHNISEVEVLPAGFKATPDKVDILIFAP